MEQHKTSNCLYNHDGFNALTETEHSQRRINDSCSSYDPPELPSVPWA